MEFYFNGLLLAVSTFFIIGIFHPIVIKTEYHTGTKLWWLFLVLGIICIAGSLLIKHIVLSAIMGVVGASFLWSIGELFAQKKRVQKGWFPMNKKRAHEYSPLEQDDSICPVTSSKRKENENSTYIQR